ncbi:MAG TPA: hypothetical protein VFR20_06415 [Burkholderiaceae bacterium]|nr:hypothetical protein [Burkholderiaceae bacterium]
MNRKYRFAAATILGVAMLPLGASYAASDDPATQFVAGVQAGLLDGAGVVTGLDSYGGVPHASAFEQRGLENMVGVLNYCLKARVASGVRNPRQADATVDNLGEPDFERVADAGNPDGLWQQSVPDVAAVGEAPPQICRVVRMSVRSRW